MTFPLRFRDAFRGNNDDQNRVYPAQWPVHDAQVNRLKPLDKYSETTKPLDLQGVVVWHLRRESNPCFRLERAMS